jgi:starch synthase (maltosyl-transferring)
MITIQSAAIELAFSRSDGGLRALRYRGGPSLIGYGEPRGSIDVQLGDGSWMAERAFVRYLRHTQYEANGATQIQIVIGLGPLVVYDSYQIRGDLIMRRVRVQNVGDDPLQLRGVRLALPWARIGTPASCRFEAPGSSVRPRISLATAAEQRLDILPRRFFAPGLRDLRAIEPAPLFTAGLMILYCEESSASIACWYQGETEPALAQIDGRDGAVTIQHEVGVSGWLVREGVLTAASQYVLLQQAPWDATLERTRATWLAESARAAVEPQPWVRDAALLEVHPGQLGGFSGLARALPAIADLGVNTLCLMPIWAFGNGDQACWDGNWLASGDPYALRDFATLDPALGSRADFAELVGAAHTLGLRVLVDLPLLGGAPDSPMIYEHSAWFCRDGQGRLAAIPGRAEIVAFDWANSDLRSYVLDQATALMADFPIDGFRAITPRQHQPNWAGERPHHSSAGQLGHLKLLEQLRTAMQASAPAAALIGDLAGPIGVTLQDASIDELAHHMFIHTAHGRMTPAELSAWLADHWCALPAPAPRIAFTESHRTRLITPLAEGMRGSRVSRMLLAGMVLCGFIPSLWHGQEQDEATTIRQLLRIRREHAVVRCGSVQCGAIRCSSPQVFTVLRRCESSHVIGLMNVGPQRQTVSLDLSPAAIGLPDGVYELEELISGRRWEEEGHRRWDAQGLRALRLTLDPFAAYCLVVRPALEQAGELR